MNTCLKLCFLLTTLIGMQSIIAQEKFKSTKSVKYYDSQKDEIVKFLPVYRRELKNRNGNTMFQDFYIAGNKNYLQAEGFLNRKDQFVDTLKTFYENGNLESLCYYVDGNKEGVSKKFYNTGELSNVSNFKNGELRGSNVSYYKSGNLMNDSFYFSKDSMQLIQSLYDSGKPNKIVFKNSQELDSTVFYKENGNVLEITSIEPNDIYKNWFFYENGQVSRSIVYINGEVVESDWYDEEGNYFKSPYELDKNDFKTTIDNHVRTHFIYPTVLQEVGLQARVFVNFKLKTDGTVEILGTRTSGHPLFEIEAARIIKSFTYKKFTNNNIIGDVSFSYPIVFRLN